MSELEDIYFLHGTWVFSIGLCCVLRNKIGVAFGSAWFKSLQASSAAVSHVFWPALTSSFPAHVIMLLGSI